MRISLDTSGGFTGQQLHASMDSDELSALEAFGALQALEELADDPPEAPPVGASQPRYKFTLHRDAGERVVEVVESRVPPVLRPLIAELVRRGRSQT
jgi:hypothetical protein